MLLNNKVLIVEDEEHIRKFIKVNLEKSALLL